MRQENANPCPCVPNPAIWSVHVEDTKTNYLVTKTGSGGKVRQLRQDETLLSQPVFAVRREAVETDEAASEKRHLQVVDYNLSGSDNSLRADILTNSVGKATCPDYITNHIKNQLQGAGACVSSTYVGYPLRLITARTPVGEVRYSSTQTYLETLDCGHQILRFSDFHWDDGHLVNTPPKAKRRRCQECGESQIAIPFPLKEAA